VVGLLAWVTADRDLFGASAAAPRCACSGRRATTSRTSGSPGKASAGSTTTSSPTRPGSPEAVGTLFEPFSQPRADAKVWFYNAVTREDVPPLDDAVTSTGFLLGQCLDGPLLVPRRPFAPVTVRSLG
jgi:hypothetical protein